MYLYYHSSYGHQTRQDDKLPWLASAHKVTWPSDYMDLRDQVKKSNHYIFTIIVSMTTKLARMATYLDGLLPIKSHHLWSHIKRSHGKLKFVHLHYHDVYGQQTGQDGKLSWWTPFYKVTWPFDHVVFWDHLTN